MYRDPIWRIAGAESGVHEIPRVKGAVAMEFRTLGPLEARDGDRALPLGGRKAARGPGALLLLAPAGELVSSERLIDDLWGGRPPASAASTLHVYASRLRKLLPPDMLVSEGRGYRLAIGEAETPARRFERLADRAMAGANGGGRRASCGAAEGGAGIVARPPLADFAYEPFAQGEIARLEELRLAALEERIEADLARGRHAELAAELDGANRLHIRCASACADS